MSIRIILLSAAFGALGSGQGHHLPPPPPPHLMAKIQANCRTTPKETIPLVRTDVPIPKAPAELNLGWALKLEPANGARIGRVIGLTQTWRGAIVAATDRGYWIRIPSKEDEAWAVPARPVAVSIRDLPSPPGEMGFAEWSGDGLKVWLSVPRENALLRYEIAGCFPGAQPEPRVEVPTGQAIVRFEPTSEGATGFLLRVTDGSLRLVKNRRKPATLKLGRAEEDLVRSATTSALIQLARGCDRLSFHRDGATTVVRTSCSSDYLASLDRLWSRPHRQHRQPQPLTGIRMLGRIDAPIVAISNAVHRSSEAEPPETVRRGDRSNPGEPCAFLLAAQAGADSPIFIYGIQPYCAYHPRDPTGAPFPPPPGR